MQSQVLCGGCRTMLVYPRGASNVRCALCSTVTTVQSSGLEMDHIICGCCHTWLMYSRGASSVRCLRCHTLNLTPPPPVTNQIATLRCGNCQVTLTYPFGAPSVKCAVCQYITNVGTANQSVSSPIQRQNDATTTSSSSISTVVVENPKSIDGSGKLVSNVVVGVTTEKK